MGLRKVNFKNHFLDAEQLVFSWTKTTLSPVPESRRSFSSTSSFSQPCQSQRAVSGGWIIFSPCLTSEKPYLYLIFCCLHMYWFHDVYRNFKHAMRRTSYIVIMKIYISIYIILYLQTSFLFSEHRITWFGWLMMITITTRQWLLCAARRATRKKE